MLDHNQREKNYKDSNRPSEGIYQTMSLAKQEP